MPVSSESSLDILHAKFAECSDRMKAVWADEEQPRDPEYAFRIEFVASKDVGERVRDFVSSQPTRDRRIARSADPVGGGSGG